MKKPRIAIIAPPFIAVPPKGQGGTERIVYQKIEGLTSKGYSTTLFGAGRCRTSAKFAPIFRQAISEKKINGRLTESSRALRLENVYIAKIMEELKKRQRDFDIVFNHARAGYLLLPLSSFLKIPVVNILHLPIFKELGGLLASYEKPNVVTVSDSQRKGFPGINYLATVHNGVDIEEFRFCSKSKDYFLFMGALAPHKNPKDAILAAKKARAKLILAGGKKREPYFSKEIMPLVDGKIIKYAGEVSGKKRLGLLGSARALLFPIEWPEPFGLAMIEAMACGTPVIAYSRGAVPEVVRNGKTGFIVKNVQEMTEAIKKIGQIDRSECRKCVEQNFSKEKMISGYEKIITALTQKN